MTENESIKILNKLAIGDLVFINGEVEHSKFIIESDKFVLDTITVSELCIIQDFDDQNNVVCVISTMRPDTTYWVPMEVIDFVYKPFPIHNDNYEYSGDGIYDFRKKNCNHNI